MPSKNRQTQLFEDVIIRGAFTALGPLNLGTAGNRFFVSPGSGDDNREGNTIASALATMQEAIDRCVDDEGDVIVRMRGTETVSAPVQFNKQGVTVVAQDFGMPARVRGEAFTTYNNQAAGLSAAVVTKPCRLIGVGFAASDVSEEALLIDCAGAGGFSGGFVALENCRFSTWNGAIACGVRTKGGALNHIVDCEFDGLFGGFGTAAIIMENDGALAPFYPRVVGSRFMALGSGKHAIVHAVGSVPVEVLYAYNVVGASGKFLDNNSVVSTGIAANNLLGGADATAMFENMTNSTMRKAGNSYDDA